MGCPRRSDGVVAGLLNALEAGKTLGLRGTYFLSFVDAFSSVARVCSCASYSWSPLRGPFWRPPHTRQKLYNSSLCVSHGRGILAALQKRLLARYMRGI
jgi:hypothetical protein